MTKSKHGFTLIEVIAIITILGLAAAITLPAVERSQERVEVVREGAKAFIRVVYWGLPEY